MNADPKFLAATASVDQAAIHPLPNSRKVYVEGSRPGVRIDIRAGLAPLRAGWIEARGDTEALDGPSSHYGCERLADRGLVELRFDLRRTPRRARAGRTVTQMHYARRGEITPEIEFVAIR